jgi:prefoldin alpha subunit
MSGKKLDEEIQEKYIHLQLVRQQLSTFIEEKSMLEKKMHEMNMSLESIRELKKTKKGIKMWAPLGSGSFVASDIKDNSNVLVSVGMGVMVKKNNDEAVEILSNRLEDMKKLDIEMLKQMIQISQFAEKLEEDLQKLAEKQESEQ